MKTTALSAITLALAFLGASAADAQSDLGFRLINESQATIDGVYVRPVSEAEWFAAPSATIPPQTATSISLPGDTAACELELEVVFGDGTSEMLAVNACTSPEVSVH